MAVKGPSVPASYLVLLLPKMKFLLLAAFLWSSAGAYSVVNTSVEYVPSPLALDLDFNPSPRFAWVLEDAGSAIPQTSYRITVVTARGNTVWDSGTVASSASTQVAFGSTNQSTPLTPDTDYTWTVCACSFANCACSSVARFSSALSSSSWAANAVFVGGFPAVRGNFSLLPTPITRARLYVSGVGVFDAWVNGVRVGSPSGVGVGASVLAPGWSTVAPVRVLAHAYDGEFHFQPVATVNPAFTFLSSPLLMQ